MPEAYDGREIVGMDLHRRRSVLVRMTPDGKKLGTRRISNDPAELRRQFARAGVSPRVVLEATYGCYWAADAVAAAGAEVHLAHPLGVRGVACRRERDERDAADLADLLRTGPAAGGVEMGRYPADSYDGDNDQSGIDRPWAICSATSSSSITGSQTRSRRAGERTCSRR
jgi:hypothetical protein